MLVELIDVDDKRWPEALSRLPHDFYHLPEYAAVESRHHGCRAAALYGTHASGTEFLVPLLVRPLPETLQLPDSWSDATVPYGYAAPVTSPGGGTLLNEFLRRAAGVAQENGIISLFLRWHPLWAFAGRTPIERETIVDHGETVFVDLSEEAEQWHKQTRNDHRYNIRRLRRLGFEVEVDEWTKLEEFHRIYLATMERVSARKNYHFPLCYFGDLRESLGPRLHLASVVSPQGSVAASGLFSECCGIVQYHLSGTDESFLRLAPMKLLLDHIRSWAKERGNRVFHLGGGVGGQNDALFDFKAAFSKHRGTFRTSRIVSDHYRYQEALASNQRIHPSRPEDYFPAYRCAA